MGEWQERWLSTSAKELTKSRALSGQDHSWLRCTVYDCINCSSNMTRQGPFGGRQGHHKTNTCHAPDKPGIRHRLNNTETTVCISSRGLSSRCCKMNGELRLRHCCLGGHCNARPTPQHAPMSVDVLYACVPSACNRAYAHTLRTAIIACRGTLGKQDLWQPERVASAVVRPLFLSIMRPTFKPHVPNSTLCPISCQDEVHESGVSEEVSLQARRGRFVAPSHCRHKSHRATQLPDGDRGPGRRSATLTND